MTSVGDPEIATIDARAQAPALSDLAVEADRRPAPRRAAPRIAAVLAALVGGPLLIGAVCVLAFQRSRIAPLSDLAITEMVVRDVGRHAVLTGPYSRFTWHHPGPAMFYLLAVPYRVLGSSSAALYAGAGLWNAATAAAIVLVVGRRCGRALAVWTAAVLAIFVAALSPGALLSPWNPLLAPLPLVLFVLLAWRLALGESWALPCTAALGTFLVQTHVGYLPAVAVATIFGCIGAARSGRRPTSGRAIVAAVAVLGIMWLPAVVDQLSPSGGNLGDITSFFVHAHPQHSLGEGLSVTVRELGAVPSRAVLATKHMNARGQGGPRDAPIGLGVVTIAALAGACVIAWRRRAHDVLALLILVALLAVTAVFAVTRVDGELYDFLVVWIAALSAVAWVAIGATALLVDRTRLRLRLGVIAVGSTIACVAFVGNTVAAVTTTAPRTVLASPEVVTLARRVEDALPKSGPARGAYIVTGSLRATWFWTMGLALQLERHHIPVTIAGWRFMVGRRSASSSHGATSITVGDAIARPQLRATPTLEEIATLPEVSAFVVRQRAP